MIKELVLLIAFIGLAMVVGKLVSKLKLPAILGWLVTGMIIGPHALGWMSEEMMNSNMFHTLTGIGEVAMGIMIGTELIWSELKESGKQIMTICITEAFGTMIVVTLVFGVVFAVTGVPVYLACIFGAIALATAPAPSISIINEYKAKGPVSKTLIPLAVLDDVVALLVFFIVMGIVSGLVAGEAMPFYVVPLMIVMPIVLGAVIGVVSSFVLKRDMGTWMTRFTTVGCILVTVGIGSVINTVILPEPLMNMMLMGVSFAAAFANCMTTQRLHQLRKDMMPILGVIMIIMILNLGAPLDYHLIMGAGAFTAIYIIARAVGKLGGAYVGAAASQAPDTVKKYLGFTLLPHSGVSLIFTGMAVGTLSGPAPEYAMMIQGTIAAAAVINEIIAVFLARQGFKWAGELQGENDEVIPLKQEQQTI
ncbi:MAG: cation:proton antiporter [Cellulosilyticaceae bacterium]